jgi:putative ABC transport system permease protein
MRDFVQNLRLVVRSLARRPAFSALVILTLALGIGANSAIFTVVRTVLLKPLPYDDADRLALVWARWTNFDKTWLSEAEYLDFQRMDHLFQDVGAWANAPEVALTGNNTEPESVLGAVMTANLLEVLGMRPMLGRAFTDAEQVPNGPQVAMLGYDLWQRRFAGDAGLVGRTVDLNGVATTVVGILPPAFRFPLEFQSRFTAQVVQPLAFDRSNPQRGSHYMYGIGRLQPGVAVELVNSELANLTRRWTSEGLYPRSMRFEAFAVGVNDEVSGGVSTALKVLAVAVGFLLLLTCANVANLVLTRTDGRAREIAVRAALGAGKRAILRWSLVESALLSGAGAILGLGLAWAGVRILVARAPTSVPRLSEATLDVPVLLVTLLLGVATTLLFGLIPGARVARLDLAHTLREGSRGASEGGKRQRSRSMLIVTEMALAVLLVIGAGLMIRSFAKLQAISPGLDPANVLTLRMNLSQGRHPDNEAIERFYRTLGDEVRQMPGVTSAGFVRLLPLSSEIGDWGTQIEGRPVPPGEPGRSADWQVVTPGYFETMRIPLVRGRFITASDTRDAVPVVVINETLAREYFPNRDPVGKRLRIGGNAAPWLTIVGITGDVHHNGLTTPVKRAWFIPHEQWALSAGNARRAMTLTVRTTGDPWALLPGITAAVRRMDPDLPLTQIALMDDVLSTAVQEQRFTMALMSGFAAFALLLAAIGIYGVISYSVSQRTREMGIRIALGADVGTVRRLVLRQGLLPAGLGILGGVAVAALAARSARTLLYGVAPWDPLTFTAIPLLLLVVAALSIGLPALRASRVPPVEAMRME